MIAPKTIPKIGLILSGLTEVTFRFLQGVDPLLQIATHQELVQPVSA